MPLTTIADPSSAGEIRLSLRGAWTIRAGGRLEAQAAAAQAAAEGAAQTVLDLSGIDTMDTAGAWVLDRTRAALSTSGREAHFVGVRAEHATLLREAGFRSFNLPPTAPPPPAPVALLAHVGKSVHAIGVDALSDLDYLGQIVFVGAKAVINPRRWRVTPMVFHLEQIGLRGAPIILMINFFVGAIVAQQGIIQLARFGASSLAVDLVAILTLRELGVMLTSIMVAGRTGSAITAEIGAMNMREEVDALKVMAVDPIEVLVLPRLVALMIALPLLTFLGDIAALFGGLCATWGIAGVSPSAFLTELQYPVAIERLFSGLIKAPFMALTIGVIAASEGFSVQGSAESLGARVTASVVKSIFMVIVLDGVFAMFYGAIKF